MDTVRVYYTSEGWLCELGTANIPIENESQYIDIPYEIYDNIKYLHEGYCWRLVNGELVEELYNLAEKRLFEIEQRLLQLKNALWETDFKAIKYFEGYYTEQEYAPIKAEREEWRNEIRALEKEMAELQPANQ